MGQVTPNERKRKRQRAAIPKDDPRRQELLGKDFMQAGYIEGLPDAPAAGFPAPPAPSPEPPTPVAPPHGEPPVPAGDDGFNDTGGMLDPMWASELVGDVPDRIENDDLVSINGFGYAGYDPSPDAFQENGDLTMAPADMPPAPAPAPVAPPQAPAPEPEPERHHRRHRGGRIIRWLKRIILLLLLIAVFVGGFAAGLMYEQHQHPSVSAAFIETQLSECSDLATAKMHYNGLVHYEDGDIPLINKKTFSMTYQAEVRAGIDLSQAEVTVSNGTITVILPKATVQTTSIDPSSVKFFDQTWGLFSWESKDDAKMALEQAQIDLEENMDEMRLIEEADMNAEQTVRGLIAPILKMNDGYKLDIQTAKE